MNPFATSFFSALMGILPAAEPATTTFAFTGDIMMGTTYPENPPGAYLPSNDGADLFRDATPVLAAADFACGNLEGTMIDRGGTPKRCSNENICFTFRMPEKYVGNLVNAGYDFLSIANNHANDFGPEGVKSTIRVLSRAGIAHAGNRTHCPTAVITEKDGRKVGFAAFGHSLGTPSILDYDELRRNISALRRECDLVVVSFHGGGEGHGYTHVTGQMENCFGERRGNVREFARKAIDAGADIVYGHGPHVTRGLELYNDHLIIYSLGNFCTPYRMGLNGISAHAPVVTATLDSEGRFIEGKIHSFIQTKGIGPRHDPSNSVARQMQRLSREDFPSSPLRIADDGTLSRP